MEGEEVKLIRGFTCQRLTHPDFAKPLVDPLCAARKEGEGAFLTKENNIEH
jgi:hypothetical protein